MQRRALRRRPTERAPVLGVRAPAARPRRRRKKAPAQLGAPDEKADRCLKGHLQRFIAQPGVAASRFCLALLALDASGDATTLDAAASTSELFEHCSSLASKRAWRRWWHGAAATGAQCGAARTARPQAPPRR